ncbi:MAG: histidine phosphatase family protein [Ruminococcaceae bacterium]|nr:histidine phosphatase family protein [Oscillospiraceae bacterium]
MKTHIYFIRHGQSEGNLYDLFLGHTDMDLTELGRKQAQRVTSYFESIQVDAIFSSDLSRAYHTACPLAEMKGLSITKSEKLREIYAGEWEGLVFNDIRKNSPMGDIWWEDTGNARPDGGESVAELQVRILAEVERLAKENEGKTICIFTHFTPIYALRTAWEGVHVSEMKRMPKPSNASVTHAIYENGVFSELVEYANNDYLGDLDCPNRA